MSIFAGIILGLVQGLAEFLPVSSSGHLKLFQELFGLEEVPLLFDVFLHLATLLSVCLYFRKKIWELLCAFGKLFVPAKKSIEPQELAQRNNDRRYILAVIIATIITAAIGLFQKASVENANIKIVCAGFLCTAFFLIMSAVVESKFVFNKIKENNDCPIPPEKKSPNIKQSLVVGIFQGLGTLPGISRSGSTIAGAIFSGMNREAAGEFSFIISIPAILGAFVLELKDIGEVASSVGAAPVIAGCAAAFASGYIAITFLMKLIKKGRLQWFAAYLIPLGLFGLFYF